MRQGLVLARSRAAAFIRSLAVLARRALVHAHARGDFVDQVNGLIGQEAIGDIAGRKVGGGVQGFIGDDQVVVFFVSAADALEDFDGLFDASARPP